MKKCLSIFFNLGCLCLWSQIDSTSVNLHFTDDLETVEIRQKSTIYNDSQQPITTLGIHAWINAYQQRKGALSIRKLEERKSDLYFSKLEDRAGLELLKIDKDFHESGGGEFIEIPLKTPLACGSSITLEFRYVIKIPPQHYTKYGRDGESALLKYFILQPAKFYSEGKPKFVHFIDLETLPTKLTHYKVKVENDFESIDSNIEKIDDHHFEGSNIDALSLVINPENIYYYDLEGTQVSICYTLSQEQEPFLEKTLRRQLRFLQSHYAVDVEKLLITFKTKKLQNFTGIDDIEIIGKYKIRFFTQQEQIDLKMFQMVAYESLRKHLNLDLEKDHWILNGLLTYMQINYIMTYYPNLKLAGHLPDDIRILGITPLKWFFAADLNLTDRYKLAYLYIVKQNYEQDIVTPFSKFNRINQTIISGFKTGIGFNYMKDYLEEDHLDSILRDFLHKKEQKYVTGKEFQTFISERTKKNVDWFFEDFLESSDKLNFKFVKFQEKKDSLLLTIDNKTEFKGPFKVVAMEGDTIRGYQWYEAYRRKAQYSFPNGNYDKLVINPGYTLAEFNYRDNYLYTRGFFKNGKKVKFRLYGDIENPEYNHIFVSPLASFNNYDKVILGAMFSNYAFMMKQLRIQVTPSFSTGTGKLTGDVGIKYNILPEKGMFRSILFVSKADYYHYNFDLSYMAIQNYIKFNFIKDPRSAITRSFFISFQNIDKESDPNDPTQDIESLKYNLLELAYVYRDDSMIFEKYFNGMFEYESKFSKINLEWFGRYEYAPQRKFTFRWFLSYFLFNKTVTDYFNTGVSRISDYSFGYNLLARSDDSGIFSQQYVMAEGGFISKFNFRANKFLSSVRSEFPIWKMFLFYGGMGIYKNKGFQPEFIYETGIKLRLIPDFFELYFPVQSTLGFEPQLSRYYSRIRFTFNLNFSALKRYFERGWY